MRDKIFVDTNIWVYAHLYEAYNTKCERALSVIQQPLNFTVSVQVLNEYYSVMLRNQKPDTWIQHNIQAMMIYCNVSAIDANSLLLAHRIKLRYGFSYWDSLVVASALETDCRYLYTEDLQNGQELENTLIVMNPLPSLH